MRVTRSTLNIFGSLGILSITMFLYVNSFTGNPPDNSLYVNIRDYLAINPLIATIPMVNSNRPGYIWSDFVNGSAPGWYFANYPGGIEQILISKSVLTNELCTACLPGAIFNDMARSNNDNIASLGALAGAVVKIALSRNGETIARAGSGNLVRTTLPDGTSRIVLTTAAHVINNLEPGVYEDARILIAAPTGPLTTPVWTSFEVVQMGKSDTYGAPGSRGLDYAVLAFPEGALPANIPTI